MNFIKILCLCLLLGSTSQAQLLTCAVTQVEDSVIYPPFKDGFVQINLQNGNVTFHRLLPDTRVIKFEAINDNYVSSFRAPRKACEYTSEIQRDSRGELLEFKLSFKNCSNKNTSGIEPYTSLAVSTLYNFSLNQGYYFELIYDGRTKMPLVYFQNCK